MTDCRWRFCYSGRRVRIDANLHVTDGPRVRVYACDEHGPGNQHVEYRPAEPITEES